MDRINTQLSSTVEVGLLIFSFVIKEIAEMMKAVHLAAFKCSLINFFLPVIIFFIRTQMYLLFLPWNVPIFLVFVLYSHWRALLFALSFLEFTLQYFVSYILRSGSYFVYLNTPTTYFPNFIKFSFYWLSTIKFYQKWLSN